MPFLKDISVSAITDTGEKVDSIVRQLNEWGRSISNERRTDTYKDNSGTPRIILGVLPDGDTGIVISKSGSDVLTVFS